MSPKTPLPNLLSLAAVPVLSPKIYPVPPKRKSSEISDDVGESNDFTCAVVDETDGLSIAERILLRPRRRSSNHRYFTRAPTTSCSRCNTVNPTVPALPDLPQLEADIQKSARTIKIILKTQHSHAPRPIANDSTPEIAQAGSMLNAFESGLSSTISRSKAVITGHSSEVAEKKRKDTQVEVQPQSIPQVKTANMEPRRTKKRGPVVNPFISKKLTPEGKLDKIILRYPSPNSFAYKNWNAFHKGELGSLMEEDMELIENEVGAWRSAALWEFTGKTFDSSERLRLNPRAKHRKYAKRLARLDGRKGHGPSGLSNLVSSADEEEQVQDQQEFEEQNKDFEEDWRNLFIGSIQACPAFSSLY